MASPPEARAAVSQALVIVCCVKATKSPGTFLSAGLEATVSKNVRLVRYTLSGVPFSEVDANSHLRHD